MLVEESEHWVKAPLAIETDSSKSKGGSSRRVSTAGPKSEDMATLAANQHMHSQVKRRKPPLKKGVSEISLDEPITEDMLNNSNTEDCLEVENALEKIDLCKDKTQNDCSNEQRLLNNMGVHHVILELLEVPYEVTCKLLLILNTVGLECEDLSLIHI